MIPNRRLVFFAALVGVMFVTAGVGTVAAQSASDCSTVTYNGDGTEANPYEVGNVEQLQCIEEQGLDAHYEQVSDIDASGTSAWNGGDGFDPIGDILLYTPFTGTFDGADHTISNLYIDRVSTNDVGLFGLVDSGRLENVRLNNVDVSGGEDVGALVGNKVDGTVRDSYATGSVSGNDFVGGLVGGNNGPVENSYATGDVSGDGGVGGLVGGNNGPVENLYATGDVSGDGSVGGLVGYNEGNVTESYATGNVSGDSGVGGLVGDNVLVTITESYATGNVSGNGSVGGLSGYNTLGTVEKSYATGGVSGIRTVGGLIGENDVSGTVRDSYATGKVDSSAELDSEVGGLIGEGNNDVTDSYWDTETTGQSTSDGGTGLTTPEMTGTAATSNMVGFDFTTTWETVTSPDDYPILAWQTGDEEGGGTPGVSPVDGVSDELWNAITADDGEDGLSLADLGNAIQEYQSNPGNAEVDGVDIGLSDLGALIQYQNEVA